MSDFTGSYSDMLFFAINSPNVKSAEPLSHMNSGHHPENHIRILSTSACSHMQHITEDCQCQMCSYMLEALMMQHDLRLQTAPWWRLYVDITATCAKKHLQYPQNSVIVVYWQEEKSTKHKAPAYSTVWKGHIKQRNTATSIKKKLNQGMVVILY